VLHLVVYELESPKFRGFVFHLSGLFCLPLDRSIFRFVRDGRFSACSLLADLDYPRYENNSAVAPIKRARLEQVLGVAVVPNKPDAGSRY
jgi:hypothetical protein